jgi:HTH-type transcriptional regulator/antitoxin HigA
MSIQTDEDYHVALRNVSALFDNEPEPGTPEGDYFDIMITLIEAYESKQFLVEEIPVEASKNSSG